MNTMGGVHVGTLFFNGNSAASLRRLISFSSTWLGIPTSGQRIALALKSSRRSGSSGPSFVLLRTRSNGAGRSSRTRDRNRRIGSVMMAICCYYSGIGSERMGVFIPIVLAHLRRFRPSYLFVHFGVFGADPGLRQFRFLWS